MTIKLTEAQRIIITNENDLFCIMQGILSKEEKIDQNREHFWVVGLENNNRILFIELISLGSINATIVEPLEVFTLAVQQRAVRIILVHNHPSGSLELSEKDWEVTDRLHQVGIIMKIPVLDHIVMGLKNYMSFKASGLFDEISKSLEYVCPYKLAEDYLEEGRGLNRIEVVQLMKQEGESIEKIAKYTGLSEEEIFKIKVDSNRKENQ